MSAPPNLAKAAWLAAPATRRVFALIADAGEEARVVGGAVRNALMGQPVTDIDFATTALPGVVTARAAAAGIRCVPTGIEHGTVTLVIDGQPFEVTTLREDVDTDGRRAVVRFGRDWQADAERRDFTMNALSVDAAGTVHDLVGGLPDIAARRVRFIGDPERRIAEDRLRILRLFRFHAQYGVGDLDAAALSAAIRARHGLRDLSAERVGQEMRKLVVAPRSAETLATMQDSGILPVAFAGAGYTAAFARGIAFGAPATAPVRLALIGCRVVEDVHRLTERLRLSNAERDRMLAMVSAGDRLRTPPDTRAARRLLHAVGAEAFRDGVLAAASWSGGAGDAWRNLVDLPERAPVPKFPLGGRDIVGNGISGPAVGALLRAVEAWWIAEDFAPDEAALRARLQQMIAAQQ